MVDQSAGASGVERVSSVRRLVVNEKFLEAEKNPV
jgi:hypothetical protein